MFEEVRGHDPAPTEEELAWMSGSLSDMLLRVAAVVALALTMGVTMGEMNGGEPAATRAQAAER